MKENNKQKYVFSKGAQKEKIVEVKFDAAGFAISTKKGDYTGINDKNSKPIHEGDIVKAKFDNGDEFINNVYFTWGAFRLQGPCISHYARDEDNELAMEVIGSIYDT